jgi:hypothetical protein
MRFTTATIAANLYREFVVVDILFSRKRYTIHKIMDPEAL